MSNELDDLYQEIILDHNRHPANFRSMVDAHRTVEADNPLCGDRLTLYLKLDDDGEHIADLSFQGSGCAISVASASLLTQRLKGATVAEAEALFETMRGVLTGVIDAADTTEALGGLAALAGVRRYPMRVKCATLSWHALKAALGAEDAADSVSTE
ncbi:Fe-S cluster assembly sulfur transfer protein SufU [Thiohalocapsa sp. ML1]|uniref:Fe-S cluster assembly sulfur transfer protein SufU n=1 Tax=Thiohalocapsa sp. ML1 TaxID=1431688 RepID=UPI0007321364|nr:SUF system NifU family Fe-S cluster assembly protein [Thiohalocapsa sp. ML1]